VCEVVKICLKHLRHTEFDLSIKELLNEIKFDRKLARTVGGDGGADDDDANMEDWEYRNYKDGWVSSFEKLRDKLVSSYKVAKYNQQSGKEDGLRKEIHSCDAYQGAHEENHFRYVCARVWSKT
jgi:hypothetical protein